VLLFRFLCPSTFIFTFSLYLFSPVRLIFFFFFFSHPIQTILLHVSCFHPFSSLSLSPLTTSLPLCFPFFVCKIVIDMHPLTFSFIQLTLISSLSPLLTILPPTLYISSYSPYNIILSLLLFSLFHLFPYHFHPFHPSTSSACHFSSLPLISSSLPLIISLAPASPLSLPLLFPPYPLLSL
jgi:hypothetical protein